jgi:hypothetical protein
MSHVATSVAFEIRMHSKGTIDVPFDHMQVVSR